MATIRKLEIENFRGIKSLIWHPHPGLNCLIGPGDSGKSTILDAIDLCLGARRTIQIIDADFFELAVENPISITITLGNLGAELKSIDGYALYLRGYDRATHTMEDEPGNGLETVLSLNLRVESDLEPVWSLISDRAQAAAQSRNLSWTDRNNLSPVRIGALSDHNLSWRRGSLLNRLSDETADASVALLDAARSARKSFGVDAEKNLGKALAVVTKVANELGIDVGAKARAELEAHSVSVTAGTISLHDDAGVPLRRLGIGSTRLMISGLQQKIASESAILLVDELEHGLEPHRIIRFLDNLGAKQKEQSLQVFLTSHSPIAVRELAVEQLSIVRSTAEQHEVKWVGDHADLQGTLRLYPEAFLARSVLVCEGASEVGLVRGFDQARVDSGKRSMHAAGTCLVSANGYTNIMSRANAFLKLGYRVATFRDDDFQPPVIEEVDFQLADGEIFTWREGRKLEVELFDSLPVAAVETLLASALEDRSEGEIDSQLRSYSNNLVTLETIRAEVLDGELTPPTRLAIGNAAGGNKEGKKAWFKSVAAMEEIGREIVGRHLEDSDPAFRTAVLAIRKWCINV
ncbi:ATP-dependent endonuclease [Rhizobium leguminosarum]|uniref:ATP-dependent nuclease n=1 Tax=Rhizobium leguminosarum TaxID=384 RepID=UPI0010319870|nr:ATP-binding protein [Rhizobium leguminosarum]TAY17109.1 ATP-dependent endonuclease [Rhizobium leguminosarum]